MTSPADTTISPPFATVHDAAHWLRLSPQDLKQVERMAVALGTVDPVMGEWVQAERRTHAEATRLPLVATSPDAVRAGAAPVIVRTLWLASERVVQLVRRGVPEEEVAAWHTRGVPPGRPALLCREVLLDDEQRVEAFGAARPGIWRALFEGGTVRLS